MESLCGNSYGCLDGEEMVYTGAIVPCSRCRMRQIAIIEFIVGEEIEFFLDDWWLKSTVDKFLAPMREWWEQEMRPRLQAIGA